MGPTTHDHIVTSYGEELDELADELARMGGLVEIQVADALTAVVRRDDSITALIRKREITVNAMQADIEKKVIRLFALRQPMATDLRMTISALRLSADLERIGDLAKNIAYRSVKLKKYPRLDLMTQIDRMGKIVQKQLREVLDALSSGDIEPAVQVWRNDDEVDQHYNALIKDMLSAMAEDSSLVDPGAHVLFVAKNLERIGDHATNIAEAVHFQVTGDPLEVVEPPETVES